MTFKPSKMSPGLLVGGMKCRGIKCLGLTVAGRSVAGRKVVEVGTIIIYRLVVNTHLFSASFSSRWSLGTLGFTRHPWTTSMT